MFLGTKGSGKDEPSLSGGHRAGSVLWADPNIRRSLIEEFGSAAAVCTGPNVRKGVC